MLPFIDRNVVDPKTTRYRRNHNTAVKETEERLNELYGGYRTILCNSGMEAINTTFDLIKPNTVIVDDETYFETRNYLLYRGQCDVIQIEDLNNLDALEKAIKGARTPFIVCGDTPSTFGNWKNVRGISELTHRYGGYVMMDNSIASIYYCNPLKDGADICVESYTKYVIGYGDGFAGGIALNRSMEWLEHMKMPNPAPRTSPVNDTLARRGNHVTPETAYLVARGLETLKVRMDTHTKSARLIYQTMKNCGVDAQYSGCGGLITLPKKTEDFCKKLAKFVTVGTFGCTYSNADFFRNDSFYRAGFCARLSIGLENPDELIKDVENALGVELTKEYERLKCKQL